MRARVEKVDVLGWNKSVDPLQPLQKNNDLLMVHM